MMTFEQYVTELDPTIRHLLVKYNGMKTDAEDLYQEAMLLILQIMPKLDAATGEDGYKKLFNTAFQNRLKQIYRDEHSQLLWISQGMTEAVEALAHDPVDYLHDYYFEECKKRSHAYYLAHRERMTPEERQEYSRKVLERYRQRIAAMTQEELDAYKQHRRDCRRQRRARMTPEQREEETSKNRERRRRRRERMTPEERQEYTRRALAGYHRRRAAMTPEELEEERRKVRERRRRKRARMTPEELETSREKAREYARARRAQITYMIDCSDPDDKEEN